METEYGFKTDSGTIKCIICNNRIDVNNSHRKNCCKSAHKKYLKSIGYWKKSSAKEKTK